MVQVTSWEGQETKRIRTSKGLKGFYTRYHNRRTRQGLQLVKNGKYANFIYNTQGDLVAVEPKYHNYNSNDPTAVDTYKKKIEKEIQKMVRQNPRIKNKITRHGD